MTRHTDPAAMAQVLAMVAAGIAASTESTSPLAEAGAAQADLDSGRISGSAILVL